MSAEAQASKKASRRMMIAGAVVVVALLGHKVGGDDADNAPTGDNGGVTQFSTEPDNDSGGGQVQDWNNLCDGGAICDPNTGMPNDGWESGGGLSLQ
jgi:hypothetical protein